MPTTTLTDRFVASIAGNGERQQFHDLKIRGLTLRVAQSGDPKTWSYLYRAPVTRKKQRATLGVYPAVTLADARLAAQAIAGEVAKGNDPLAAKREVKAKAGKAAPVKIETVRDLVEDHLRRATARHRTTDEKRRRLEVHFLSRLGDVPLDKLRRADVSRVLDELMVPRLETRKTATGKTVKVRVGGPALVSRLFDDLRRLTKWAVSADLLPENILAPLERPAKPKERQRALSADELALVLRNLGKAPMTADMQRCIRLLILTACRCSEIAELRWSEVRDGLLVIPPERIKNDPRRKEQRGLTVPLPRQAIAILEEQRRALEAAEDRRAKRYGREPEPIGDAVFPAGRGDGTMDGHAVTVAWRRAQPLLGIEHATLHDLRRSAATRMAEDLGIAPHIVEVALNHVSGFRRGVAGTYNVSTYSNEHREALRRWADCVDTLERGPTNVLSFPGGRAS